MEEVRGKSKPSQDQARMKNTFISVKEIQESNSTKEQRFETFEHPEDLLTLKIAQVQGGKISAIQSEC
jgi:hypothetical protein